MGGLLPLQAAWGELGLGEILSELAAGRRFSFDVSAIVKAMVFQRVLVPGSERALVGSWLRSVYAPEFKGIEPQHAYRALRFPAKVGPQLEERVTGVLTKRLFADASLVLFDTTSTYFEVVRPEGVGPEGLASFGFSRDKRGDRPQVNLGLHTSRECISLAR